MDVLLFLFIIAFGTVLVLAALPGRAPKTQPLSIADSLASFLATTTTRDVIGYTSGITFTSLDRTILEQAALFITDGNPDDAKGLVKDVIVKTNAVPSSYSVRVELELMDEALYLRASRSEDDSEFLISSKRIVFFYDAASGRVIGPSIAEVRIWRGEAT